MLPRSRFPLPVAAPVLAVLAVALALAACGDDTPAPDPVPPSDPSAEPAPPAPPRIEHPEQLDEESLLEIVHAAAVTETADVLAGFELPPRVSRARVAVAALHEHLAARRTPAADDEQMFAALRALAALPGGAEASVDVPRMVEIWSRWSAEQRAAESELGQIAWLATAALSSPDAPGAEGLRMLAERGEAVAAPPQSPAAGVLPLLHLAASTLEREEGAFSEEHEARLAESSALFATAGWPAGGAPFLAHLAAHLVNRSESDLRSIRVFEAALSLYIQNGDPLRAGLFLVDRAQAVTRETDPRRALAIVERGRRLVEQSGGRGVELFHVLDVHAGLLQTVGRHADAVDAATEALRRVDEDRIHVLDVAALRALRAVSLFRLGLHERAYADAGVTAESLPASAPDGLRAHVLETAAQSAFEIGRYEESEQLYRGAAAAHDRRAAEDRGHRWARDGDLVRAAGALAKAGRREAAVKEVRELLSSGSQPPGVLALAATTLVDAGDLGGAAQVVEQAEAALGAERRDALGEIAARVFAARGEFDAARERFAAALSFATRDGPGAHGPSAAGILVSWADTEERDGYPLRALRLRERAASHLAGDGAPGMLDQIRSEIVRLARRVNERATAQHYAVLRVAQAHFPNESARIAAHIDRFLTTADLHFAGIERAPDPSGVLPPSYLEVAREQIAEFPREDGRAFLTAYLTGAAPSEPGDPGEAGDPGDRRGAEHPRMRKIREATLTPADRERFLAAPSPDRLARIGLDEPELRRRVAESLMHEAAARLDDPAMRRVLLELADAHAGRTPGPLATAALDKAVLLAPIVAANVDVVLRIDGAEVTAARAEGLGDAVNLLLAASLRGSRADVERAATELGAVLPAGMVDVADGRSIVILMDEPHLRLPWDLVRVDGRSLIDRAPLSVVTCAAEWVERVAMPTGATPPFEERYVPRARSALVPVRGGAAATDALAAAFENEFARDGDAAAALRRAKLTLRKSAAGREGAVPAWASLLLRGP